ncbi:MAG: DUF896 domain-containing protein, partial [Clostridia bacterium]|nr:DUF896 domain-containing protein [Clostridia bacterium]
MIDIKRIHELARKATTVCFTDDEKEEQALLSNEYVK